MPRQKILLRIKKSIRTMQRKILAQKNRVLKSKSNEELLRAAQQLVTPFTGFVISDWYWSSEIDDEGIRWLNHKSKRLSKRNAQKIQPHQILYCQVDQLDSFSAEILPKIKAPFILISGKWHLPALIITDALENLLDNPLLLSWYSQNQIYDELPIRPFPYGISLRTVKNVYRMFDLQQNKTAKLFIPFASSHTHLIGEAKSDREQLANLMEESLPIENYLTRIGMAKFVVCPAGDRPETYRHWETIALGSVPISNIPKSLQILFGNCLVNISPLCGVIDLDLDALQFEPKPELALVNYWKKRINLENGIS